MAGKTSQNGRGKTAAVMAEPPRLSPPAWCGPKGIAPPRSVAQARRILSKLISAFIRGEIADGPAKTLTYLLVSFVGIIRDSDFEKRLQALEQGGSREPD